MRQFLLSLTLAAGLAAGPGGAAMAQDFSPVVYVNNSVVTRYELDQRIRFMQALNAPEQGREAAERALIDDRLRMEAARAIGVEVSEQGLDEGLAEFAARGNMSIDEFVRALAQTGVDREAYRDFVQAGVAWREVVRRRILPNIGVSDAEVDQALQRIIETPIVTEMAISEIIIPAPPGQEAAILARAEQLSQTIRSEEAFAQAARQLSATPSAAQGGRLPWMRVDNMPPGLRPILLGLSPGQVTPPLTIPGAVVLFMLRDTRGELRPGAREQQLDYMVLHLASLEEAQRISALARSCDDLYVHANHLPDHQVVRQSGSQNAIPQDIAILLASLDENESSVFPRGAGGDVVMLCDRTPALIAGMESGPVATGIDDQPADRSALPNREAMRNQVLNQKVNAAAEGFLAELRADAIIRRP
ncbi:MAG: peptidylprolyl isomerase [Paracoccus sp. (in: a-proteobacteria)]|nr:peptidylprolyl isomerase [Paracoccus sp. (in: a-proteobacteria)]